MEWPVFTQRYAAEAAEGLPGYWDLLVVMLVVLLGVIGFLVTRLGQKGTAHTLQLVTLRPRNIVTMGEYRVSGLQYIAGLLFAVIQVSLFLLLLSIKFPDAGSDHFWISFDKIALGVSALLAAHYALMSWVGYTFSEASASRLLLANVTILFILFGASLSLPILLSVFTDLPASVPLATGVLFYAAYRIWFVVRALAVMPKLAKAPLLIIWYLCTCEFAPLYLAYRVTVTL